MNKTRLSKEDWEKLDDLLGKHGYGGYYDFLECLKIIGRHIGARTTKKGAWDFTEINSIPELINILLAWSWKVNTWRLEHPKWEDEVLWS